MSELNSENWETRSKTSLIKSELPYGQYLNELYPTHNIIHNEIHKDPKVTSDMVEWYHPDWYNKQLKIADEIKMGNKIPTKKLDEWYPLVAIDLLKKGWEYRFIEATQLYWFIYDMKDILKVWLFEDGKTKWKQGIYDKNPQPYAIIPSELRIKSIKKPEKYIWKSQR